MTTDLAATVADCCSRVVGAPVRVDENFFLAGLDSLGAVEFMAVLVQSLSVQCPDEDLLEAVYIHADAMSFANWLRPRIAG